MRRSQLITTYGVGAMIALGEQSYVVSGLDSWVVPSHPSLKEFRLQTRLGVDGFMLPPGDETLTSGVRVRLFPRWYTCPGSAQGGVDGCTENLREYERFNPTPANKCGGCGGTLTPSRFVVACADGHLSDFPYFKWVHYRQKADGESTAGPHRLTFRTTGRTAALRSIIISCSCGRSASMEGAFGTGALKQVGYTCKGGRPWLGSEAGVAGCDVNCRTLQRGSSAAWFPVVRSALTIPPYSNELHEKIGKHYYKMWKSRSAEDIAEMAVDGGLVSDRYSVDDVLQAFHDLRAYEAGERPDPATWTGFEPADVLRAEEFRQLNHGSGDDEDGDFLCLPPRPAAGHELPSEIHKSMLVHRLREVRALHSFMRVDAPVEGDEKRRFAALSLHKPNWLPGVEVLGEGVFLRLDDARVAEWESGSGATDRSPEVRARRIRHQHEQVMRRRIEKSGRNVPESPVRARLLLVHTLAHALINEWSLDAGYPAASLRERLYVSDDMVGLLIYTASSDSAGSLGGLVEQGETRNLARSLESALNRVSWCSADPLCMEADAAGTDSLNLAACHSCVLLPETSCELNNTFLDRAMLVGDPGEGVLGFFRYVI